MMRRRSSRLRRFARSTRGVAATEFAMILPLLLLLLLGFYDAMTALAIYTKTRYATAALAEITNQYSTIHDSDLLTITSAACAVLAPYVSTACVNPPVTTTITLITIGATGAATVGWSNSLTPGASSWSSTPAPGTPVTLPTGLIVNNSNLIYCQVSYVFTPVFGFFTSAPITLSDSIYSSPRNSASIARVSP
jgi:Flp pilus assembly protein TadG